MKNEVDTSGGQSPLGHQSVVIAGFLKGLANRHRLLILGELLDGEKNVSQLIEAVGIPQTSMSQHLAKLKEEHIVDFRREHRTLFYRITSEPIREIMAILYRSFLKQEPPSER